MSVENREAAQLRIAAEGAAMTSRAKVALLLIGDLVDEKRVYWESRERLALRMGCAARTAYRAVRELEDCALRLPLG